MSIIFLWIELGPSTLAGLAVMILIIPLNFVISVRMRALQAEQMKYKDERLKMMSEILNGMKVLKLYAWEPSMEESVRNIRQKEINILKRIAYWNALSTLTWSSAPFLVRFARWSSTDIPAQVAVASFTAFVLSSDENVLTPGVTFTSLALFNILRFPMSMLAGLIGQTVQLNVSNKRVKDFLACEQLDPNVVNRIECGPRADKTLPAVKVEDGEFTWDVDAASTLKDLNVNIGVGQLVAVVGQVGSGKSSLLSALLGEMNKLNGSVTVRGSVAYVPQQAWIQNMTLQVSVIAWIY